MDSKIVWIELLGVQRGPCQVPNILRHTCGPLFRSSYELNKTHLQAFVRQSLRQARWSLAVSVRHGTKSVDKCSLDEDDEGGAKQSNIE